MPYADSAATARRWATERAVTLWAVFAGDLSPATLVTLAAGAARVRADGAHFALVVASGQEPSAAERALADLLVKGPAAPAPFVPDDRTPAQRHMDELLNDPAVARRKAAHWFWTALRQHEILTAFVAAARAGDMGGVNAAL